MHGRQRGDTDIDFTAVTDSEPELPVLRDSLLGDVEIGQYFNSRDGRILQVLGQVEGIAQNTIDTEPDPESAVFTSTPCAPPTESVMVVPVPSKR